MSRKAIVVAALVCAVAWAQAPAPKPTAPPPPKPKAKKVFTEEDLGKLRGGVSVVGDTPKPKADGPATDLIGDIEEDAEGAPRADKTPAPKKKEGPSNCLSAAWAKLVDSAVRRQGLRMPDGFWHGKLFGNPFCMSNVGGIDKVANSIEGDYAPDAEHRYRVTVERHRPLPPSDEIVQAHENGAMLILVWKGKPYGLESYEGVRWTDTKSGATMRYELKRLRLIDLDTGEMSTFVAAEDKETDISGSFYLQVTSR